MAMIVNIINDCHCLSLITFINIQLNTMQIKNMMKLAITTAAISGTSGFSMSARSIVTRGKFNPIQIMKNAQITSEITQQAIRRYLSFRFVLVRLFVLYFGAILIQIALSYPITNPLIFLSSLFLF